MALESWEFGDPETVAIRRQEEFLRKERACGKCKFRVDVEINKCQIIKCQFKRREYGVRCELYRIKTDD